MRVSEDQTILDLILEHYDAGGCKQTSKSMENYIIHMERVCDSNVKMEREKGERERKRNIQRVMRNENEKRGESINLDPLFRWKVHLFFISEFMFKNMFFK